MQESLGYTRWENFEEAIGRAFDFCQNSGIKKLEHFREVAKMDELGSGAKGKIINAD